MGYEIRVKSGNPSEVYNALFERIEQSRFFIDVGSYAMSGSRTGGFYWCIRKNCVVIEMLCIRLREKKDYCGNHAGPCRITYGGIDMGHTLDGVDITITRAMADVFVDRYGETPVDKVITGSTAKAKFKMAQWSNRQWDVALPEGQNIDTASLDQTGFGVDAGYNLRQNALPLVIHPLKYAVGDLSHDVTFYLCVNTKDVVLPFKVKDQLATEVEMEAFVSEAYGSQRRLGHLGYAATS